MSAAVAAPTRGGLESLSRAQRDAAVTAYLIDARDRLALALEATGPEQVKAIKAEASVVAEMSRQVGVSKEIQTDAQEMVRRAEFALGKAIRAGQEAGTVATKGQRRTGAGHVDNTTCLPTDLATQDELSGNGAGIYHMSDNVTPEEFEVALSEARAEGNVSRANVVRKVKERTYAEQQADKWDRVAELADKGWAAENIAREVGMTIDGLRKGAKRLGIEFPADTYTRNRRRIDTNEVLRKTVAGLEGMCMALAYIDLDQIEDAGEAQTWVDSLTTSIRTLSKVNRQIKESIS